MAIDKDTRDTESDAGESANLNGDEHMVANDNLSAISDDEFTDSIYEDIVGSRFSMKSVKQSSSNLSVSLRKPRHDSEVGSVSGYSYYASSILNMTGTVVPWLTDPGSMLGSSIILTSPSYLDMYQRSLDSSLGISEEEDQENMEELFDNPEYIDTLQGRLPLVEAARMIAKDSSKHKLLFDDIHIKKTRKDCYNRIFACGVAFLFLYSSYFTVRNSQVSLGTDKKLCLISYGALFSLMWFGGVCANPAIQKLKPKWAMVLATLGFIIYPLAQFYPSYFTLIPVVVVSGFSCGLLWSVEGVYVMNTASVYALVTGEKLVDVVVKFNGIVFSCYLGSNIFGNLLASFILGNFYTLPGEESYSSNVLPYNHSIQNTTLLLSNSAVCGLEFYEYGAVSHTKPIYYQKKHIFFGVATALAVLGCLVVCFFVKPLRVAKTVGSDSIWEALKDFFSIFIEPSSLLMLPSALNFGFLISLILADYTTAFVSCEYGADKVGYVVTLAYVFSVSSAFLSSKMIVSIGRVPVLLVGYVTELAAVVSMLLWTPVKGTIGPLAFVPFCLWGISDGILYTQCNSLVCLLFKKRVAQALTMICSSLAIAALLGTLAIAYSIFTLAVKVYIVIFVTVLSIICYIILEILIKRGTI